MSKGKISVGDDTPSGEPESGPKGPYITDDSDDETRVAEKSRAGKKPGRTETEITQESELGSDNGGPARRR
jgi:hypothetical protein